MLENLVERLRKLDTSAVSDALDHLGLPGAVTSLRALPQSRRIVGSAITVQLDRAGAKAGPRHLCTAAVDACGPATVIVVVLDNQGRLDATVWGDLLTSTASRRKIAGTVIDGVCRDLDRSIELHYPIFARGNWMRTGKDRVRVDAIQQPVSIGGVRIEPGDYLLGDGDGVVAVPVGRIEEVTAAAEEIHSAEEHIRNAVGRGQDLRTAREEYGYHKLQTRQK